MNKHNPKDRWRDTDRARIERRRTLIARMLARGMRQHEIMEGLKANFVFNPDTGAPYSYTTITNDIAAIKEAWREEYIQEIHAHTMLQLMELREARRQAWANADMAEVRQNLKLEIELLGTKAPDRLLIADWREEARAAGIIDPDGLLDGLVAEFVSTMAGTSQG